MNIIGNRRFTLTLVGLLIFGAILIVNPQVEPLSLGIGIGFLLTPHAVSKFGEAKQDAIK